MFETVEVDIKKLISESLRVFHKNINEKNLTVITHIDSVPGVLFCDLRSMRQTLINLLSNAVKFTPAGGRIELSAGCIKVYNGHIIKGGSDPALHSKRIDPKSLADGDFIQLCLKDSGIGISSADLDRIFNPFEQADGSSSREYQGTGLGLSLTKRLVEMQGGKIWAESDGPGETESKEP